MLRSGNVNWGSFFAMYFHSVTAADTVTPESLCFRHYSCLDALHKEGIKSCHLCHLAFLMKVVFIFLG